MTLNQKHGIILAMLLYFHSKWLSCLLMEKNNPKVMNAWAFYDWANSVYNLVISTAVFPMFFGYVTSRKDVSHEKMVGGEKVFYVDFWGIEIVNTTLYAYAISLACLLVVILMPILSGIADYQDIRKRFLKIFCYIGSLGCMAMFYFDAHHLEWSMLAPFIACFGFWGSLVFYNSYLPIIATPDKHDALSAKGFSLGYIGSVILLIAILAVLQLCDPEMKDTYTRFGFLAVGIWWAGFAQYTYKHLPKRSKKVAKRGMKSSIQSGYNEFKKVWQELKPQKRLTRFLAAFFSYNMGVQTVLVLAVLFAEKEINWPLGADGSPDKSGLIISMILIQLVAVVGAYVLSKWSSKKGNIFVLKFATLLWVLACVIAFFITEPYQFYMLAGLVGFVMGGIQSLSRSTYSKLLPKTNDPTSYFTFYDALEKVGLALGPFLFGTVNWIMGGMRPSVLVVMTFFIIGYLLLIRVPKLETVKLID